jgi:CheY-like chemotaxis protein
MGTPRILLVDDEYTVARGFARVLEKEGYETQLAGNGLIAAEALARARFDALVVDLCMPEREGLETIREAHRLYPDMGIVAVSGAFGGDDLALWLKVAIALGAAAALKKPVSSADLLHAVAVAVGGAAPAEPKLGEPPGVPVDPGSGH